MNDVKDSAEFYRNLWANAESRCDVLRAEVERLRVNAERWEYARTILTVEAIEAYERDFGHGSGSFPNEADNLLADAAIDAARGVKSRPLSAGRWWGRREW